MPKVGALAICKAHPFVFGAFVAIAVGIVVYNIVKTRKQKNKKHAYRGRGDDDDDDDSPRDSPVFYTYDASTKSVTDSAAPIKSNATENNLRRRSVIQNSSSKVTDDHSKAASEMKSKSTVSREVQTESTDINQNDIFKILPDKDLSIAMSADERISNFLRNIPAYDSPDDNDETDSQGNIKKEVRNCCCDWDSHSEESSYSSTSVSSGWSDISLTDADNMKKKRKSKKSRASSVCSGETETSVGTVLSGDSEVCRGCEEKPVNTHAQPCNHRYLCSDCAMKFFRLYKKCKVCRVRIEQIVFED